MIALTAALAALALAAEPFRAGAPPPTTIELEGRPLRLAALSGPGGLEVLLLSGRELERHRLEGRRLVRIGAFQAPGKRLRPLLLDAAPAAAPGDDALVTAVFAEDVDSVDQGTDTLPHGFVLSARADGTLAPASADLKAYLRVSGGKPHAQSRGNNTLFFGSVRAVEGPPGKLAPAGPAVPWAGRGLLEATPLPGGAEALAWENDKLVVVSVESGRRVPGGSFPGELGTVKEPRIAIRLEQPLFAMGIDKETRQANLWFPVARRVAVLPDGSAYTFLREREKRLLGKATGQDGVVRLDWKDGALATSAPYPPVEAFVLDFAVVERPGGAPLALLLTNDKEDGSGQAYLVVQEPR